MDHSAFDAYGLLIEADGRRVYYSGDFRAHGRKSGLFEAMIKHPAQNIDVLLMEGTTMGKTGTGKGFSSEADLEEAFVQAFSETEGIHFVWASAQNIDRIVTIFRAAKRTNRLFVIDLYTAVVLEATGRESIPQSFWTAVRLYTPASQRRLIVRNALFEDLRRHSKNRVFPEELGDLRERAARNTSSATWRRWRRSAATARSSTCCAKRDTSAWRSCQPNEPLENASPPNENQRVTNLFHASIGLLRVPPRSRSAREPNVGDGSGLLREQERRGDAFP